MKKYSIARLNKRAEFGTYTEQINENTGMSKQTFQPGFSLWFGNYTQTIQEQLTLTGNNITDSKMIVIRHNDQVNGTYIVRIDENLYKVSNIVSDDGIDSFDVITLVKYGK
uniref:phage head closure protein n=1 Tax=Lentilactobacillus hilgardii TaxID=1588 RepID=UPI00403FA594